MRRELLGVTDHFAVLGIPHAAWLDADDLKERFHRLSAQHHPDASGGSAPAFTDLNGAWQTLRDPAKCLRHYLEHEHPAALAASEQTPPELSELFMDIAAFRQAAQRLATRIAAASTPLTRAFLEPERIALRAQAESLGSTVAGRSEEIIAALKSGSPPPEQLSKLLASLVFLGKWTTQIAETRLGL